MVAGNVEQRLDPRDWVVWVDPRQIRQLFFQKPKAGHGGGAAVWATTRTRFELREEGRRGNGEAKTG